MGQTQHNSIYYLQLTHSLVCSSAKVPKANAKQIFIVCSAFILCILILLIKYGRLTVWHFQRWRSFFSYLWMEPCSEAMWVCLYTRLSLAHLCTFQNSCLSLRLMVKLRYICIIPFSAVLVQKIQHLTNIRKHISLFVNLDSFCALWEKTDFQNFSSIL